MIHPDLLYQLETARQEDIRNEFNHLRQVELFQGIRPNRIKALMTKVATFAKRNRSKSVRATQTSEIPQVQLQ